MLKDTLAEIMATPIYIVMGGYRYDESSSFPYKAFRTKDEANEYIRLMELDEKSRRIHGQHCESCPAMMNCETSESSCRDCIEKAKAYCGYQSVNMEIEKFDHGDGTADYYVNCDKRDTPYDEMYYYIQECDFVEGI